MLICDYSTDLKIEQRANIKFCVKLGKSATETLEMLRQAYDKEVMSRTRCFEWHSRFMSGRTSRNDDERLRRPSTSTTPENVEDIGRIVRQDRGITIMKGQTVDAAFYCTVLRRLREKIRRKRPELWRDGN